MNKFVLPVLGTAAAIGLCGCVALKYEPISYDMPKPAELSACADANRNSTGPCVALVQASQWHSPAGLQVAAGQAYCIEVPPDQRWFDASHVNTPPQGDNGTFEMNLVAWMKRVPEEKWFTLIVAVTQGGQQEASTQAVAKGKECGHNAWEFEPAQSGDLVFYPNDASAVIGDKMMFYRNNGGQIWVKLTRLR